MKRVLLTILAVFMAGSLSFAQTSVTATEKGGTKAMTVPPAAAPAKATAMPAMQAKEVTPAAQAKEAAPAPTMVKTEAPMKVDDTKTITQKVEEVTSTTIVTEDEKDQHTTFSVTPTTTIYGATGAAASLKDIKGEDTVKIKYKTENGVNEATAIYLTK